MRSDKYSYFRNPQAPPFPGLALRSYPSRRGFTLIEVMLSALIIALLAGGVVVNMRSSLAEAAVESAARNFCQSANFARDYAVISGRPCYLEIQETAYRVWRRSKDGDPITVPGGGSGVFDTGKRVTIDRVEPSLPDIEGAPVLMFDRRGRSVETWVTLDSSIQMGRTIHIPANGLCQTLDEEK